MAIERVFKFWLHNRTARARPIRPISGFRLQPLEGRIALSAGLQIPVAGVPASASSVPGASVAEFQVSSGHDAFAHFHPLESRTALTAGLQVPLADAPPSTAAEHSASVADFRVSPGHDVFTQSREADTDQERTADSSGASSTAALTQPASASMGVGPSATILTTVEPGNQGAQASPPSNPSGSSSQAAPDGNPDGGPDQSQQGPSEPDPPATPDPGVSVAQTNGAEDEFDPGLLDPLAWIDSEADQFSGEADDDGEAEDPFTYAPDLSSSGYSIQQDIADETGIGSYSDYLAGRAWSVFSFELTFSGRDELDPRHGMQTVDAQNNSIMAGTIPWRRLLSGLNLPDRTALDEHQRFPALGPLEQSSPLALVATLWTTPSWAGFSSGEGGQLADRLDRHPEAPTPLASWNVYVMRLDDACERSYRGISQGLIAMAGATRSSELSSREPADGALWPMPIVPMARADRVGASRDAVRTDGGSLSDQGIVAPDADLAGPSAAAGELESPSRSQRDPQFGAEPGRAVLGTVPIVTVITGSTLVAGWFWSRRASWPRIHRENTRPTTD